MLKTTDNMKTPSNSTPTFFYPKRKPCGRWYLNPAV